MYISLPDPCLPVQVPIHRHVLHNGFYTVVCTVKGSSIMMDEGNNRNFKLLHKISTTFSDSSCISSRSKADKSDHFMLDLNYLNAVNLQWLMQVYEFRNWINDKA